MTISFDGGKTMMNFAEAALLIQGSTCIYGRKVNVCNTDFHYNVSLVIFNKISNIKQDI